MPAETPVVQHPLQAPTQTVHLPQKWPEVKLFSPPEAMQPYYLAISPGQYAHRLADEMHIDSLVALKAGIQARMDIQRMGFISNCPDHGVRPVTKSDLDAEEHRVQMQVMQERKATRIQNAFRASPRRRPMKKAHPMAAKFE